MLEVGTKAPEFTLPDQDGNMVSLADFHGQKVVLYFYPKDSTAGCTREAVAYKNAYDELTAAGVKVLGLSKDSVASHRRFADKYELPFTLLSDAEITVLPAYDAWKEKKLYGKVSMGTVRSTVLIDEEGRIEKVWPKAKPDDNAGEVLAYVKG
jgi:peroxiredoxin Q/BCP